MRRQVTIRTSADFGTAVAEARRMSGLTQLELAEQTGLGRTYLARMESGLTVALLDRLLLVLRRLGAQVVVTLPAAESTSPPAAEADVESAAAGSS